MVHTDQMSLIKLVMHNARQKAEYYPVPVFESKYYSMSEAHRQVISMAQPGERVALINADMIPSIECFAAAEKRFEQGRLLIMMAATRTKPPLPPPTGVNSRELLEWVWKNRHPWIEDCIWGSGRSYCPSCVHFVSGNNVITRAFHLHPFAFVKQAEQGRFVGLTIDDGLLDQFTPEQMHIVTDPDEASFAEISPASLSFGSSKQVMTVGSVAHWATRRTDKFSDKSGPRASKAHRILFRERIVLRGEADPGMDDVKVCAEVLKTIEDMSAAIDPTWL